MDGKDGGDGVSDLGKNFGVIIAFLLPGFLLLWSASASSPQIGAWLNAASEGNGGTVGGFLYATLASLALGLLISAVRELGLDWLHHRTGVKRLTVSFSNLARPDALAAFQGAIENYYRYHQYYGNTLVAVFLGFCLRLYDANFNGGEQPSVPLWIGAVVGSTVLFFASRNMLTRFEERATQILSADAKPERPKEFVISLKETP
jgi:hypothetical protein